MPETGKTVLITGAARGLGKALALRFLSLGWNIIATDIEKPVYKAGEDKAFTVSSAVMERNLTGMKMDVSSEESVAEAFSVLKKAGTALDLIINNAGIDRYLILSQAPVNDFQKVFEVNVFGAYRVNQIFLPMLKREGGRIIHIGSESLNLTMPFMAYPLSKKLLEGYARALRQELRFYGIDVIVIRPGAIDTRLLKTVSELNAGFDGVTEPDPLKRAFRNFASQASGEIGKVISPVKAAEFISRVAVIARPKAVYRINNMMQLRIASLLPFSLIERIVHKRLSRTNP